VAVPPWLGMSTTFNGHFRRGMVGRRVTRITPKCGAIAGRQELQCPVHHKDLSLWL
jgi:hypothetical protein